MKYGNQKFEKKGRNEKNLNLRGQQMKMKEV
jgi:hypothetical protein